MESCPIYKFFKQRYEYYYTSLLSKDLEEINKIHNEIHFIQEVIRNIPSSYKKTNEAQNIQNYYSLQNFNFMTKERWNNDYQLFISNLYFLCLAFQSSSKMMQIFKWLKKFLVEPFPNTLEFNNIESFDKNFISIFDKESINRYLRFYFKEYSNDFDKWIKKENIHDQLCTQINQVVGIELLRNVYFIPEEVEFKNVYKYECLGIWVSQEVMETILNILIAFKFRMTPPPTISKKNTRNTSNPPNVTPTTPNTTQIVIAIPIAVPIENISLKEEHQIEVTPMVMIESNIGSEGKNPMSCCENKIDLETLPEQVVDKSESMKIIKPVKKEPVKKEPKEKEPVKKEPKEKEPVKKKSVKKEPVKNEFKEKEPKEKEPVKESKESSKKESSKKEFAKEKEEPVKKEAKVKKEPKEKEEKESEAVKKVPESVKNDNEVKVQDSSVPKPVKKQTIAKALKLKVWDYWIGTTIGEHKCLCCNLQTIYQASFACGHIIAESKGGCLKVQNLKPICNSCNSSMGTQNMDEFMSRYMS